MSVRQGNKIIAGSLSSLPHNIGEIFPAPYASYTPEGAVLADGAEFDSTKFPDLWKDYIQGGRLLTCTYQEFDADVAKSGGCAKFAVNGNKFRVPKVGNGTFIAGGNGESFAESLPNIKGDANFAIGPSGSTQAPLRYANGVFSAKNVAKYVSAQGDSLKAYNDLEFDASQVSPAYQDNAKVQPNNIRMKFYVQVASGSVNQSMMDWSRYMQGLEGKANLNADNFTAVGKQNITSWGFPSDKSIDLSLGASDSQYTAPANGWFNFVYQGSNGQWILLTNITNTMEADTVIYGQGYARVIMPVKRGDKVKATYSTNGSYRRLNFIYAEGEK